MSIYLLDYFASTEKLFQRYEYFLMFEETDRTEDMKKISEAKKRLKQLDYLYSSVKRMNFEVAKINHEFRLREKEWQDSKEFKENPEIDMPAEMKVLMNGFFEKTNESFLLELHFEQFYYVAFRIRQLVRYLPGLGKKFEAEGVRNVRNQIIEHPEKVDFSSNGFTYAGIDGPKIITFRDKDYVKVEKDKGFFPNAEEFKTNLEDLLKKRTAIQDKEFRERNNLKG